VQGEVAGRATAVDEKLEGLDEVIAIARDVEQQVNTMHRKN